MPDIDQQKYRRQLLGGMKIALDELSPLLLFRLGNLGIAVPREVDQIQLPVDIVIIDGLRLAGLGRRPCQALAIHERIDQGGLSHVGFTGKSDLRKIIIRKFTGISADRFQFHLFYDHYFFLSCTKACASTSSMEDT